MPDSDFDLVNGLFCKIVDKKELLGGNSLTVEEQQVVLIWHASGIIENGGFRYFFEQELDAEAVASAYEKIGSAKCAELLRLSLSLFPEPILHADWKKRIKYVENNSNMFENLSSAFWEADKETESRLGEYVRHHKGSILNSP